MKLESREEDGKEELWQEGAWRERRTDFARGRERGEVVLMVEMESRIELPVERWVSKNESSNRKEEEKTDGGQLRIEISFLLPFLLLPLLLLQASKFKRTYRFPFFTSSLTVLSLSISLSCFQLVILERVPLLLTTIGPRASNVNTPPATPPSARSIST